MKQQCKPNTFPDQRRLSVVWLWGDTVMVGRKSSNGQLEVNVLDSALSLNMANHHFLSLNVYISELKNLSWIKIWWSWANCSRLKSSTTSFICTLKKELYETSLVVQWLWLWVSATVGTGSTFDLETKIPHAACVSSSVVPDSLRPHGLQPSRLLSPWDFPGKDPGVICHFFLQHTDAAWCSQKKNFFNLLKYKRKVNSIFYLYTFFSSLFFPMTNITYRMRNCSFKVLRSKWVSNDSND